MTGTSVEPDSPRGNVASKRLVGNSLLFLVSRIGGAGATFLTQVWLAQWLGAELQGRYVEAFAWMLLLSSIAVAGQEKGALRFLGDALRRNDDDLARGYTRTGLRFVLLFSCALAAAGYGLSLVVPGLDPELLMLAMLAVPLMAASRFLGGLAHAWGWFSLIALPQNLIRPLIFAGFVAAGAFADWPFEPVTILAVHGALIGIVVLVQGALVLRRSHARLGPGPARSSLGEWLRVGGPILMISMYSGYFPELNVVLFGQFHSGLDVALLNAALKVSFLIALGLIAVDQASLPGLARLHAAGDIARLQRTLGRATLLKVAGSLLGLLLIVRYGEIILGLFGEEFRGGAPVLAILAVAHLITALLGPAAPLLALTGHQDRCLPVCLLGIGAAAALHLIPGSALDLEGAALGILGITTALAALFAWQARRALGIDVTLLGALRSPKRPPGPQAPHKQTLPGS